MDLKRYIDHGNQSGTPITLDIVKVNISLLAFSAPESRDSWWSAFTRSSWRTYQERPWFWQWRAARVIRRFTIAVNRVALSYITLHSSGIRSIKASIVKRSMTSGPLLPARFMRFDLPCESCARDFNHPTISIPPSLDADTLSFYRNSRTS